MKYAALSLLVIVAVQALYCDAGPINHATEFKQRVGLNLAGGYFSPANGTAGGGTFFLGFYSELSPRFFAGGEFDYTRFSSTIFGVRDVPFNSIGLTGAVKYYLLDETVTPYIGGGAGYSFKFFDKDDVERRSSSLHVVSNLAKGFELVGIAGVSFEAARGVDLFAEARYSVDFIVTETNYRTDVLNMGGFAGIGGIRIIIM
jgi:hypothetical protein